MKEKQPPPLLTQNDFELIQLLKSLNKAQKRKVIILIKSMRAKPDS